ncbi:NAD(P)-binding protein [Leucogyrophana mollusca]|uniref:NAD(P)-binding protein n=1 Tax=Leucogyrophana mollusca TaxID=85980 RepID=A0ACB8BNZ6_9AGAM|nr:NAD(P)-binding protein [Leucogyrophana mollusca]
MDPELSRRSPSGSAALSAEGPLLHPSKFSSFLSVPWLRSWPVWTTILSLALGSLYIYLLHKRVRGSDPANPRTSLTPEQLDKVTHEDIDVTQAVPPATHKGYAIIGGSGFLGTYLVRLLILRGETNIRVLDLHPPSPLVASDPSVSYIKTDVTSLDSIRRGLHQPFPATGTPPTVIYHTAVVIRFWERAYYAWHLSYNVNVLGTRNIIAAAKEIPGAVLIYTSSSDTVIPSTKFCRLGLDTDPRKTKVISDDDPPLSHWESHESSYARSKALAERLVVEANGQNGLKTGIIRPGSTITGPNDRLCTSTLTMARVPTFGKRFSQTNICAWDAVAAHLLLEDALGRKSGETAGQAFLVTGKGPAWSLRDVRETIRHYSRRPLIFDDVPELPIFVLAHLVELFLFVRYHALLPFYLLVGKTPRPEPRWMGEAVYLQPATLEFMADIVIDDSRARRVLGYEPQWSPEQWIKYTVEEIQSSRTHAGHGLQLKPT